MESINQLIKDIGRYGRMFRDERLLPLGLSSPVGAYLRHICAEPGISQEQLTRRIGINKSNVSRQVTVLEEDGYVERRVCGKDKRVLRLYPTEKAQALQPQLEAVWDSWEACLGSRLTPGEQALLRELLERMRASVLESLEDRP